MGKILVLLGAAIAALGVLLIIGETIGEKLPFQFGKLPGDISIRRENWSFDFPLTTCLILSAVATLLMWLFGKTRKTDAARKWFRSQ